MEAAGKVNVYHCRQCRKHTVTMNINKGVTPFGIRCPHCQSFDSFSNMYTLVPAQSAVTITHVWYRPASAEAIEPGLAEHVLNGGLTLCPLDKFSGCLVGEPPDTQEEFFKWIQAAYKLSDQEFGQLTAGIFRCPPKQNGF